LLLRLELREARMNFHLVGMAIDLQQMKERFESKSMEIPFNVPFKKLYASKENTLQQ